MPLLTIRTAQLDTFRRAALNRSVEQVRDYLYAYHTSATLLQSDELTSLCRHAVMQCADFGISDLRSLCWFAAALIEIGPDFYRRPNIHQLLSDSAVPPSARVELTLGLTAPEDWE